jgi:hypothetical protein
MPAWAVGHELLYVARSQGVDVYSYPEGKPEARLSNVRASGLCSDKNGDVYILGATDVVEYAHGGKRPVAVFRGRSGGRSRYCAVDSTTGSLAVSGVASHKAAVTVFENAKAGAKTYTIANLDAGEQSCAYDDAGNLFVATTNGAGNTARMFELPKGGGRFNAIAWNGPPPRLASIQWDGIFLAAISAGSAAAPTSIFSYRVNPGRVTPAGESTLNGAVSPAQFWIHGGNVAVPGSAGVTLYSYPAGGSPTKTIDEGGAALAVTISVAPAPKFAVTTYHYDNLRTGWNDSEPTLTYKNVKSGSFGLLQTVTLDDQVDAQPLVVPDETITRGSQQGQHDVVYVATENDTIYAIDASSGAILFDQSLGSPVPTPLGCNNNGPNVGITGTPVIDLSANVMYVIAYTLESSNVPTYRLHELDLSSLTDVVPSIVVTASHTLTNGRTYKFKAQFQRQRPALLEANGNVYAGFGSFCDFAVSQSRGWLLGWQTGSLTPLAANRLNDSRAKSPNKFFLSSIWMSGYGVAADSSGDVYFVTGNSDPSGTTYNGVTNIQESVVKVSSDLTQLLSIFTPSDVGYLDGGDVDFGSGGALLLPSLGSSVPPLAAAAGKDGTMYLLDQNDLGGYNPSHNNDLDEKQIGGCWCGQSYFARGKRSSSFIVGSGGSTVSLWKVQTAPSAKLVSAGASSYLPNGQDPGFFTSVSSNGTRHGAIIWAIARPQYVPGNITLVALESEPHRGSSTLDTLYQSAAGSWTASNGNANLVPVVANGKVYVASYQQLDIFGIGGTAAKATVPRGAAFHAMHGVPNEVTGTLLAARGSLIVLRTRTGRIVRVDDAGATAHERSADLVAGRVLNVRGRYDNGGVMHAAYIVRAKPSPASWTPDR